MITKFTNNFGMRRKILNGRSFCVAHACTRANSGKVIWWSSPPCCIDINLLRLVELSGVAIFIKNDPPFYKPPWHNRLCAKTTKNGGSSLYRANIEY